MIKFPWLVKEAVDEILLFLKNRLDSKMLEFGSGRSTIFFSKYSNIITVDHNDKYFNIVFNELILNNINNVIQHLLPRPYNKICKSFDNNYFDLILIDGRDRVECIKSCETKVKRNGIIILDNSERTQYKEGKDYLLNLGYKEKKYHGNDGYEKTNWSTSIFKIL